jgi:hypothetical protein
MKKTIKKILTLSFKDLSSELIDLINSLEADFLSNTNGLIFDIEKLKDIEKKNFSSISNELTRIIMLLNDNACEMLLIREG